MEPVRVLVVMGTRPVRSPFKRHAYQPLEEGARPSTKPRPLHQGFGVIVIRESSATRNAKPPRVFEVMDGKALPNILD